MKRAGTCAARRLAHARAHVSTSHNIISRHYAVALKGELSAIEPLRVGDWSETEKVFDDHQVEQFAALSEDNNPIHLDADYAKNTRFGGKIVHGMLSASLFSGILGRQIPGAIYISQTLSFKAPIYVGEKITARVEVSSIHPVRPFVTFSTRCLNSKGGVCVDGEAVVYIPHQHKGKEKGKNAGE